MIVGLILVGGGAAAGIFGSLLFSMTLLPTYASGTQASATLYAELGRRMALAGEPLDEASGPIIANFPIWAIAALGSLLGLVAFGYAIYLLWTASQSPKRQGFHDVQSSTVVVKRG
mgnify:CR=1 FL=1